MMGGSIAKSSPFPDARVASLHSSFRTAHAVGRSGISQFEPLSSPLSGFRVRALRARPGMTAENEDVPSFTRPPE